jgi:hypothetical protein
MTGQLDITVTPAYASSCDTIMTAVIKVKNLSLIGAVIIVHHQITESLEVLQRNEFICKTRICNFHFKVTHDNYRMVYEIIQGDIYIFREIPPVVLKASSDINYEVEFINLQPEYTVQERVPAFTISILNNGYLALNHTYSIVVLSTNGEYLNCLTGAPLHCNITQQNINVEKLCFTRISKNFGGYFILQCQLFIDDTLVYAKNSNPVIVIMNVRINADMKHLTPDAKITHLPYIGLKYAERFYKMGISTISDMATLDPSDIHNIRESRGPLNYERLSYLIQECKKICS